MKKKKLHAAKTTVERIVNFVPSISILTVEGRKRKMLEAFNDF